MKKIGIIGNFGVGNFGDDAILKGELDLLSKMYDLSILSPFPKNTKKKFGIKSYSIYPTGIKSFLKFNWMNFFHAINSLDMFILGGGGLLTDEESDKAIKIWGKQIEIILEKKKPVFLFGNYTNITHKENLFYVKDLIQRCKFTTVRDNLSLNFLKNDLNIDNTKMLSDFAINLPILNNKESHNKKIENIGISLRQYKNLPLRNIINPIKKFIDNHKEKNYIFLCFDKKDFNIFKILQKEYDNISCAFLDIENYENIYSNLDCIIGMRLHSIILSVLFEKPFIAISYMKKVEGFFQTLDIKYLNCIDLEKINYENIEIAFEKIIINLYKIHIILKDRKIYLKNLIKEHINILQSLN